MYFLDFETEAIQPRHISYPPVPVGLAVFCPETGEKEYYVGDKMKERLSEIYDSGVETCWHNAIFDLDVAETHLGLKWPTNFHDTLILSFLHDCHAPSLSLKNLANDWCGMAPDEQADLRDWILANVPGSTSTNFGAYISLAPVELVAPYAIGDVVRTHALWQHTSAIRLEQSEAYEREIKLLRVLITMERNGLKVDRKAMLDSADKMSKDIQICDDWIRARLGVPDLEVTSGAQLAKALIDSDCWDRSKQWPTTKTGKPSTNKQTVEEMITDPALIDVLKYVGTARVFLNTFCLPWLEQSERTGKIYQGFNSVRGERGGTRSGRLSTSPNFQNIPARYSPPKHLPIQLNPLPKVREWILPDDEDSTLVSVDYNSQELRIFAHFENGALASQYRNNSSADIHKWVGELLSKALGREVTRLQSKTLGFGILYGSGAPSISEMLHISMEEASELISAYKTHVAPELARINQIMKQRYTNNIPFRTLGGRKVKGEPAKYQNGRKQSFDYKMLNLLVQGSSADQTKQAMVDFPFPEMLRLSVHDELVISCPRDKTELYGKILAETMINALPLSVPVLADVKFGKNYGECK
jgi:DNA polymerase-1